MKGSGDCGAGRPRARWAAWTLAALLSGARTLPSARPAVGRVVSAPAEASGRSPSCACRASSSSAACRRPLFPAGRARLSLGGRCGARYPGCPPVTAPHVTPGAINSQPGREQQSRRCGRARPGLGRSAARRAGAWRRRRASPRARVSQEGSGRDPPDPRGTLALPRGGGALVSGWDAPANAPHHTHNPSGLGGSQPAELISVLSLVGNHRA